MTCLDVLFQVALEAGKQDLALARLEAIHHGGDGAVQVSPGEQDQLLQSPQATLPFTTAAA